MVYYPPSATFLSIRKYNKILIIFQKTFLYNFDTNIASIASFVSKSFVEKIIRENPTIKEVQFSQQPQIYGLAEPGKNMKKIDTLVHLRIQLRNEEEHREYQLLAEMPEIFGHDIMFGRNGQDKVVYSLLAMIVQLPSASQNEIQSKYIDWFQTTKIYTLFASKYSFVEHFIVKAYLKLNPKSKLFSIIHFRFTCYSYNVSCDQ